MSDEIEVEVKDEEKVIEDKIVNSNETEKGKKIEDPPVGSPRWNEIYWEAKEGKRAREEVKELKEALATKDAGIEEMRKWNKAIIESLDNVKGAISDNNKDNEIEALDAKLVELKAAKREAREKVDFDREVAIDDLIADVKLDIRDKKAKAEKIEKKELPLSEDKIDLKDEEQYVKWINETEWYRKNPKMRAAAIKEEKEVWQDPDFEYAILPEILAEVKARVEKKYDYKVKSKSHNQDGVEGAGGSGQVTTIKLSVVEQNLAQNLGVSNEDYAKQKALIQRQNAARSRK